MGGKCKIIAQIRLKCTDHEGSRRHRTVYPISLDHYVCLRTAVSGNVKGGLKYSTKGLTVMRYFFIFKKTKV